MKTLILAATAGLLALGAMPAAAQHRVVETRTVVRHGPARAHAHRVCRTTYRHHHRVRTCRTVRG